MPNILDIIQSVQVPQLIKDQYISKGTSELDNHGRPVHYTGGFAVVFPFIVNGEKWAFRCWSANIGNIEKRLYTLSSELSKLQLPFFCDFVYEPMGIVINGKTHPTTRMQWVEGKGIKEYICEHRTEPNVLNKLAVDFLEMCKTLHQYKIAHGDLQHGNILVADDGAIYLIDYDSMYLPALQGEKDIIAGLPDYQHPKRKENQIASEKIDYFSELIIYLSIRSIAEAPSLIDEYQIEDADRLLFTKEDYRDIKNSQIYRDLFSLGEDFRDLLEVLDEYLKKDDINSLSPFFELLIAKKVLFTASTEKAIRNKQTLVLNWIVPFEAVVTLLSPQLNLLKNCELKGRYDTTLENNTDFVLSIETKDRQHIEKYVSIKVFDECTIEFKADKYYVFPSIPVTLSWKVMNAKSVMLDSEPVDTEGKKVVEPQKAVNYILLAEDEFGIKESRIDIGLLPIPQVKSILIETPDITNNISVNIQQPRYHVGVRLPVIEIDWIKAEVPKVPSLTDLGINVSLSPPLPKFSLRRVIKGVYNKIKK
ncbi:MAG: hypothetical protein K2H97_09330 [Prevotella sp.]|nr:hypothetical protein [Prevotella sp.]